MELTEAEKIRVQMTDEERERLPARLEATYRVYLGHGTGTLPNQPTPVTILLQAAQRIRELTNWSKTLQDAHCIYLEALTDGGWQCSITPAEGEPTDWVIGDTPDEALANTMNFLLSRPEPDDPDFAL